MSAFNDANEAVSQVVYSRHYQDNEPCLRPCGITERDGKLWGALRIYGITIDLTSRPVCHATWAALATELQAHLGSQ